MIGSWARVLCNSPKWISPRYIRERSIDATPEIERSIPFSSQQRLDLHQRRAAVTALERLHDDPGLRALHDQHTVLAAHVAGRDPGVWQHTARHHALLGGS